MVEPILETSYWKNRLANSNQRHHAIFKCPKDEWMRIENKHRQILSKHIRPTDKILDAGCGWGRLTSLLPENYVGNYLGIDISPDFIKLAKKEHSAPNYEFMVGNLLEPPTELLNQNFDWAIMISIRPMVVRNLGQKSWDEMEEQLSFVSQKLLFLEYDADDDGSIEHF